MQARQVAALAESRKKADADRRVMQQMMVDDNKTLSRVNFEIKTTRKIEQRRVDSVLEGKRNERKEQLAKRRQCLADVLNTEFKVWSDECMDTEETMESRKAKLMTRAYELRDRREVERREQVKKAYETVWKDSCDDLRELDCRALDQFMGHEREKQIVEKKERKALEEINANAYYAEWTKRLDAIANADKAKQDARAEANARTAQGLQAQIANKEATQEMMYSRMMAEAAQENQECDDAIAADKQAQWQKKMDAVSRGQSVMAFNEKYKEQSAEKAQIESEHDSILLQNALKLEKAQIDFENNKKREGAEAAKKYRKYLEEMMVKEAEDTGFVDEMNKREADKVQQARDDALQARQDARDYLMKLVHEGRAEQILYKEAQGRKEKEEGKLFANRFLDDMKAGIVKDKADVDARRAKNIMNQEKLMAQMSERERAAAAVKQEVFLEDKRMQLIEKKHREKLSMQGGVVRIAFPKKRPDTR